MQNKHISRLYKSIILILAAAVAAACSACRFGPSADPAVYISQSVISLTEGQTVQLSAVASDSADVSWVSGNEAIATVSAEGLVTAKSEGEAVITAATSSALASCTVKVAKKAQAGEPAEPVDPEVLVLTLDGLELTVGESVTLKATSSLGGQIEWSSSNVAVATVSNG